MAPKKNFKKRRSIAIPGTSHTTREAVDAQMTLPGTDTSVEIPAALARLGAVRDWSPTPLQQSRIWITGLSGVGKTNFVMSNPEAFVFDFEHNCRDVVRPQAAYLEITDHKHFQEAYDWLLKDVDPKTGPRTYSHLVFDTFDKLKPLIIQRLTDDWNARRRSGRGEIQNIMRDTDGRQAYDLLQEHMIGLLTTVQQAGYGWTVVGHSVNKEVRDDNDNMKIRTQATLPPSLIAPLYRETTFMGHILREKEIIATPIPGEFIDKKKKVPKTIKHKVTAVRLQLEPLDPSTTRGDISETKARYVDHLPEEIKVPIHGGWQKLDKVYKKAIKAAEVAD